jgi:hypothetical protein
VAARTAITAKNLEALGPERLAELLIEISAGNAAAKRRLRMALAGAQSPAELVKEVRKRFTTIARSRSFLDWHGVKSLADDLDTQRRAIVESIAKADPPAKLQNELFLGCSRRSLASTNSGAKRAIPYGVTNAGHEACDDERDGTQREQFQRRACNLLPTGGRARHAPRGIRWVDERLRVQKVSGLKA